MALQRERIRPDGLHQSLSEVGITAELPAELVQFVRAKRRVVAFGEVVHVVKLGGDSVNPRATKKPRAEPPTISNPGQTSIKQPLHKHEITKPWILLPAADETARPVERYLASTRVARDTHQERVALDPQAAGMMSVQEGFVASVKSIVAEPELVARHVTYAAVLDGLDRGGDDEHDDFDSPEVPDTKLELKIERRNIARETAKDVRARDAAPAAAVYHRSQSQSTEPRGEWRMSKRSLSMDPTALESASAAPSRLRRAATDQGLQSGDGMVGLDMKLARSLTGLSRYAPLLAAPSLAMQNPADVRMRVDSGPSDSLRSLGSSANAGISTDASRRKHSGVLLAEASLDTVYTSKVGSILCLAQRNANVIVLDEQFALLKECVNGKDVCLSGFGSIDIYTDNRGLVVWTVSGAIAHLQRCLDLEQILAKASGLGPTLELLYDKIERSHLQLECNVAKLSTERTHQLLADYDLRASQRKHPSVEHKDVILESSTDTLGRYQDPGNRQ